MRRISIEHARPGMQLSKPVFHKYGELLVPAGTELQEEDLKKIGESGTWELLIEDPRVADLNILPLVKLDMQQEAMAAIKRLMNVNRNKKGKSKGRVNLNSEEMFEARLDVERLSYAIVQAILVSPLGEPNLSGCLLVEDFHYFQPVQATTLALLLARELGLDNTALLNLGKASMLQNIGYIWLSDKLWEKKSLSKEQQAELEQHTLYGVEILSQFERMTPEVLDAVSQHHERWDGTGYPNGVKGWDISPLAQLISISETYYDLVSNRPGRKGYMPADAFDYIMSLAGDMFDPELTRVFTRRVPIFPSGVMVKLSTGEEGIVVNVNLGHIGRPVVRIVKDAQGTDVNPPYDFDMALPESQVSKIVNLMDI